MRISATSPLATPLLAALSAALLAGCLMQPAPPAPPVIAAEPSPTPQAERWLLVRKSERTLTLYENGQARKVYPVVLGKEPDGAKLYQGDHRTPEGEYHIINKYFHPYWSRFMLLDYPTPMNQEIYAWSRDHGLLPERGHAEPGIGGAIGIHGVENENLNRDGIDWTEGCISLFNRDVDELYDLVPIGTRVVIEH